MKKPRLFESGEEIGGVVIIRLHEKFGRTFDTRYIVKYRCCGAEGNITHKAIQHRVTEKAKQCVNCSSKKQLAAIRERQRKAAIRKRDLARLMMSWPAPKHAVIGRYVPWYDRAHLDFIQD